MVELKKFYLAVGRDSDGGEVKRRKPQQTLGTAKADFAGVRKEKKLSRLECPIRYFEVWGWADSPAPQADKFMHCMKQKHMLRKLGLRGMLQLDNEQPLELLQKPLRAWNRNLLIVMNRFKGRNEE